ncbi:MAG: leucine-rich repeat protein, partial [Clostridia bacterium]|nr:leucine-rich repeat protein [Clostridia bacterium]
KHIADFAFETNVCCIIIPEGVETIGRYSLGHELLTYVSLPSTLTNVGDGAFSSSYLSAISYPAADVPAYEAAAFEGVKGDAWQLLLPYGTTQEQVDAFAAYMAPSAPKAVVQASIIEPYSFPKLDAEAGAPYIGNWTAVAVTDGTDFYGMDLLGISMTAVLNDDGTGVVDIDGDTAPGGWYVEDGTAIFAPILEEGGQPVPEEAMPFTLDENARMCLDLSGLIMLMEKEGVEYATPAIPEKPWPELDADKAQYYVGTWDAVSYIVDGETYPAELVGPTTLILNADGTAQMTEGEEEPYELRWYAESYSAYVGPAMSALVEIYFDMNGNLQMMQDGSEIVFAPHVDVKVIEGADELLGDWYDDYDNKLTLVDDGTLTHTYSFDGWVDTYAWDVVDGAAVVTEGPWSGLPIVLENGILIITNDEGIFQIFSRDGDLSAYYGEDDEDYDMPEAQPIGAEGEPYFGAWNGEMFGMEVILTLNPDGTCAMEMMGEAEPGVWSIVDGKANIMGDELYIDDGGSLVYAALELVFTKAGGAAPEAPAVPEAPAADLPETLQPFVGTWHLCYLATGGLEGDLRSMGLTGKLVLNADGTGVMTGLSDESGSWYDDEGQVRFGDSGMPLFLLDGGFLRYGTEMSGYMVFSQNESATWSPAPAATPVPAPTAAPAAPAAPTGGNVERLNVKFICKTYTSAGYTMDASMLGAEYALVFHDNGMADFTMAGFTANNLPYTVTAEGVYAINYYDTMFNCTPTDAGFDMDFYGTMMM